MPRLLNSAVQLKGTTGTNSYFITLSEAQPNLGTTPTTSTGYTLVTQGPLKQLVFTNTLGDIAFTDGVVYRNAVDGDLTLTSTGSGKLNLLGNVYLSGQELSANTGTFNFLYATTGSIDSLTSTNITATIIDVTSGTFDRLFANTATIEYLLADTATIFESFSAFGTVTLSPINYSVSISPSGTGAVFINPGSMGLMDNMTIGLSVPRNGYFTNLTADTLSVTDPVSFTTGTFVDLTTTNLQVDDTATVTNSLYVGGDVYSDGGSPYYNRLLYTPKVTVDTVPPVDPRIGDFWIDPSVGVEFQLVPNGTGTIWVQFIGF